ncbi:MAG: spore coat associated protein CotJA [Eubacterium sp.]|nr:spore coat associated protein CotJA [Eubacterium sp.]
MEKFEDLFNPSFLNNNKEKRPAFPKDASVTMVYIPLQEELETYSSDQALDNGTLFPELNKVFKGRMVNK